MTDEKTHLTDAEVESLCDAFVAANRAEFMDTDFDLPILRAIESIAAERESIVSDLIPGLRAEAERLRGIGVVSVALWMESEADRLDGVRTPPAGEVRSDG